jgi:hypothetical protein
VIEDIGRRWKAIELLYQTAVLLTHRALEQPGQPQWQAICRRSHGNVTVLAR